MRVSDVIEAFLKDLIKEEGGSIEIQRNNLANRFNCVPSQINYVISTRFTTERGYIVESRRGGGGCIKIKAVDLFDSGSLMHIINCIGNSIDIQSARAFIINLKDNGFTTEREAVLMYAALNDKVLTIGQPERDQLRAMIMKNMLVNLSVTI